VNHYRRGVSLAMLTIHLTVSIDALPTSRAPPTSVAMKNLVWKEVYETLQMPATFASASAERS
jgi:hypothetical protein